MVIKINSSFEILDDVDGEAILRKIEQAGRTCYKSEDKISPDSARKFVKMILGVGHESVLEHEKISVRVICDRGVTHEIVRHRIASYSQESTRYCNYGKEKFGRQITVIDPNYLLHVSDSNGVKYDDSKRAYTIWFDTMQECENAYLQLINLGVAPQIARSVLPNSLKTEIVITYNLREWRHFFKLRTTKKAHPQMRELTLPMLQEFKELIPVVFDDIIAE